MAIEKKNKILKQRFASVGSTFNRGDFTNGNAFFWSSHDLSPYLKHYIEVLDAAGKKATGYIGAVGAGETLGSELVDGWTNNPNYPFETWIPGTGSDITQAVNTGAGNAYGIAYKAVVSPLGWLIKMVATLNIASGVLDFGIGPSNHEQNDPQVFQVKTTIAGIYKTIPDLDPPLSYVVIYTHTEVDFALSDFSYKRVTDPPATAVHIVSSLNGTTRAWASIESGFNPNTISSWSIYEIFYPNIKNKFSKTSITSNIWLSSPYHNQSLITSRLGSISLLPYLDYLIGWYWNDEVYGSTVYNMAINGLLGGGLLPNLNVFNSSKYWSKSGFGYSPYTHSGSNLAVSYSFCDFSKIINQNSCFGIFIKRTDLYTFFSQKKVLEFTILNPTLPTDYIHFGILKNPTNYYDYMYRDSAVDSSPFVPSINEWYFLFIDDTDIPKIAKPNGTLYTFSTGIVPSNKLMEKLTLGAYWNGTNYVGGPGSLLGDTIIFNNLKLSQSNWGLWYDILSTRYGMTARSW